MTTHSQHVTPALEFRVVGRWNRARAAILTLPHGSCQTPLFMPVGTQGTVKGLTTAQLEELECKMILGNTYWLGNHPGSDVVARLGGLHEYSGYNGNILTDSGGYQMVSLVKLAEFSEEGVKFASPHDGSEMMLTPEGSIKIQNELGSDICMQLDDVVSSTISGPRVEDAMDRSIRWLDRCIVAHGNPQKQTLFPIIQGGLDAALRERCLKEMGDRDTPGYAIGGLSGGEAKDPFWRMVSVSTKGLPDHKPRYLMGVGYAEDLVVCSALGCDMFDCVFPTRTARFGNALLRTGPINLKSAQFARDFTPIDADCKCRVCQTYTRAYIHLVARDSVGSQLISYHNVAFQLSLMKDVHNSIIDGTFPDFVRDFMRKRYPKEYPLWIVEALEDAGINLRE